MTAIAPDETATPVPGAVRKELYKIVRQDVPFKLKAREALTLGKRYLDVGNGHLTKIDQESSHWEAIVSADTTDGSFPPESGLDLGTTYCRETIESEKSNVDLPIGDRVTELVILRTTFVVSPRNNIREPFDTCVRILLNDKFLELADLSLVVLPVSRDAGV